MLDGFIGLLRSAQIATGIASFTAAIEK
jgi:hypothetical protein